MGQAPGALIFIGEKKLEKPLVEVIEFNSEKIEHSVLLDLDHISIFKDSPEISWINVTGIHDIDLVQKIGEAFELHPLLLEDIVNTGQRPKCEEFEDQLFLSLKMLRINAKSEELITEQLSLIVGDRYLFSFQEEPGDVFQSIRDRLFRPTTKIRHRNSDYLAYALMDAVVDNYIFIIEQFGERIEQLEQDIIRNATPSHLEKVYAYKREINFLRKTVRPVRDLVVAYKTAESELIDQQTQSYIKDLEDHIVHASEAVETYQIMLNDQLNLYESITNNRLNDILRILTVFSVIFIPLTFLAGIYGMNFDYIPELRYRYAYPIFWSVLIAIASFMMFYFKRKKWL